jgi:RNA polymerase sigma factor (sigma-70 family)
MKDDQELLAAWCRNHSETAFGELVTRHIDLVYSAALRVVNGDRALAQDVTQGVFIDLARNASRLLSGVLLPGWLYRHACFTASKAVRTERRRQVREQIGFEMNTPDESIGPAWEQIAPHLDDSLNRLAPADRDALVLRYLKQQDLSAVGTALGVSEDAAQKRVSRALEKLRIVLTRRRGVACSAAALGSTLAAHNVVAAPAGLAASITPVSMAAASAAGVYAGLTLKLVTMTKLQMAAAAALLVAGIAAPLLIQHQSLARLRAETLRIREENRSLLRQVDQLAPLLAENQRLSNLVARATGPVSGTNATLSDLLRLRSEVTRLRTDVRTNEKPPGAMSAMMKDPRMMQMIRQQQKVIFSAATDKNYGELFARLHLSPERAAGLKDLIVERSLLDAERGMAMMAGDLDGPGRVEQLNQFQSNREAINARIRQFLGAEDYAQFNDYDGTVSERVKLADFADQVASTPAILSGEQQKRLLDAILDEEKKFNSTVSADAETYADGRKRDELMQDERRLREALVARARVILSPEQLDAFDRFVATQQDMENSQLRMTVERKVAP